MKRITTILIGLALVISVNAQFQNSGGMFLKFGSSVLTANHITESQYCPEFQAVYNAFNTKPHADTAAFMNAMVYSLVNAGYWDRFDVFYVLASNTVYNALLNWKNPNLYSAYFDTGCQTFASYQGLTSVGEWGVTSPYNPSIHGVVYTLNSASLGAYWRISNTSIPYYGVAIDDYTNASFIRPYGYGNLQAAINCDRSQELYLTSSNWQGQFIASRINSTTISVYKNGSLYGNGTNNVTSVPNATLKFNETTGNQVSIIFAGSGLTDTEAINIMSIINTYMTNIGANVY